MKQRLHRLTFAGQNARCKALRRKWHRGAVIKKAPQPVVAPERTGKEGCNPHPVAAPERTGKEGCNPHPPSGWRGRVKSLRGNDAAPCELAGFQTRSRTLMKQRSHRLTFAGQNARCKALRRKWHRGAVIKKAPQPVVAPKRTGKEGCNPHPPYQQKPISACSLV